MLPNHTIPVEWVGMDFHTVAPREEPVERVGMCSGPTADPWMAWVCSGPSTDNPPHAKFPTVHSRGHILDSIILPTYARFMRGMNRAGWFGGYACIWGCTGPYGTRMYQQALFREMYIIAQDRCKMECIWKCIWNVYGMDGFP